MRAALWAVGHIGALEAGFDWLLGPGGAPSLVEQVDAIARGAPSLSLRGTAVSVLGLLGGSGAHAVALLREMRWSCPGVRGACIALPEAGTTFLGDIGALRGGAGATRGGEDDCQSSSGGGGGGESDATRLTPAPAQSAAAPPGAAAAELELSVDAAASASEGAAGLRAQVAAAAQLISELSNPVLHGKAAAKLKELLSGAPHLFHTRELLLATHALLGGARVPLTTRRHIHQFLQGAYASFEAPPLRASLLQMGSGDAAADAESTTSRQRAGSVRERRHSNPAARKSETL